MSHQVWGMGCASRAIRAPTSPSVIAHAPESPRRRILHLGAKVFRQNRSPPRNRGIEDFIDRHRLAERIALAGLAAEREQRIALFVVLDALGHGVEVERVGE